MKFNCPTCKQVILAADRLIGTPCCCADCRTCFNIPEGYVIGDPERKQLADKLFRQLEGSEGSSGLTTLGCLVAFLIGPGLGFLVYFAWRGLWGSAAGLAISMLVTYFAVGLLPPSTRQIEQRLLKLHEVDPSEPFAIVYGPSEMTPESIDAEAARHADQPPGDDDPTAHNPH